MKKDRNELDSYEQEIEENLGKSFKKNKDVRNQELTNVITQMARNHTKKTIPITIRMSEFDLYGLKRQAVNQGLPYQTYINMLLHQCVTGKIILTSTQDDSSK